MNELIIISIYLSTRIIRLVLRKRNRKKMLQMCIYKYICFGNTFLMHAYITRHGMRIICWKRIGLLNPRCRVFVTSYFSSFGKRLPRYSSV